MVISWQNDGGEGAYGFRLLRGLKIASTRAYTLRRAYVSAESYQYAKHQYSVDAAQEFVNSVLAEGPKGLRLNASGPHIEEVGLATSTQASTEYV